MGCGGKSLLEKWSRGQSHWVAYNLRLSRWSALRLQANSFSLDLHWSLEWKDLAEITLLVKHNVSCKGDLAILTWNSINAFQKVLHILVTMSLILIEKCSGTHYLVSSVQKLLMCPETNIWARWKGKTPYCTIESIVTCQRTGVSSFPTRGRQWWTY